MEHSFIPLIVVGLTGIAAVLVLWSGQGITGDAVSLPSLLNKQGLDLNNDEVVDFRDFDDALAGKVACTAGCDLNQDGLLDSRDQETFRLIVTQRYDYDKDNVLTAADTRILVEVLLGNVACPVGRVCDLDNDHAVTPNDVTLFLGLVR